MRGPPCACPPCHNGFCINLAPGSRPGGRIRRHAPRMLSKSLRPSLPRIRFEQALGIGAACRAPAGARRRSGDVALGAIGVASGLVCPGSDRSGRRRGTPASMRLGALDRRSSCRRHGHLDADHLAGLERLVKKVSSAPLEPNVLAADNFRDRCASARPAIGRLAQHLEAVADAQHRRAAFALATTKPRRA